MRIVRIYQPGVYLTGDTVVLTATASQHVGVVLRMQQGQSITLFSGIENHEFSATIQSVTKKNVTVVITNQITVNKESPRALHLMQAISKGERMEWVIQKAVELGVTSITPITTSRCVIKRDAARNAKKHEQWSAIAIAACEQSGRNTLPVIHPLSSFEQILNDCNAEHKFILHPYSTTSWRDHTFTNGDIALIIGPEGGLSEDEVSTAQQHGYIPLSMGPRVLRTETAAITALSVLQAVSGDL